MLELYIVDKRLEVNGGWNGGVQHRHTHTHTEKCRWTICRVAAVITRWPRGRGEGGEGESRWVSR